MRVFLAGEFQTSESNKLVRLKSVGELFQFPQLPLRFTGAIIGRSKDNFTKRVTDVSPLEADRELRKMVKALSSELFIEASKFLANANPRREFRIRIENEHTSPIMLTSGYPFFHSERLDDLVFCDAQGRGVGTFAHLMAICTEINNLRMLNAEFLSSDGNLAKLAFRPFAYLDPQTNMEFQPMSSKNFTEPAKEIGISLRSLSVLSSESHLSKGVARLAVSECLQQLTGTVNLGDIALIERVVATDPRGRNAITGRALLQAAALAAQDGTVEIKTSPSPNVAFLKTSREPVAVESTKQSLLQEIIAEQEVPLGIAYLALCELAGVRDTRKGFMRLAEIIEKSSIYQKKSNASETSPIETFKKFVNLNRSTNREFTITEVGEERFTDLLKQLCLRTYNGDSERIILELTNYRNHPARKGVEQALADRILNKIIPKLLLKLEQISKFTDPSTIIFNPLLHQRETAVDALDNEKPIVIGGGGTGKTETMALIVEASGSKGVLWCTKATVRSDSARRLETEILKRGKNVLTLTTSLLHDPDLELFEELLEDQDYLIASYDTLRSWGENYPAHFAVLQKWTETRVKVLDEAHLLDNSESGRSRAIQQLKSSATYAATASPSQHRPERVAMLLHLTLPSRYPDPVQLEKQFRADKALAVTLLHHHSTVYTMEDIAKTFDPFDTISAADQLAQGLPRIPRLVTHILPYELSLEHTELYINVATAYNSWAAHHGKSTGTRRQLTTLMNLISNPESLGVGAPYAVLQALKEVALPILLKGEKILILAHHKALLATIGSDPELKRYGAQILSGDIPADERGQLIRDHEAKIGAEAVIGQIESVSTGVQFRDTSHIFILELPKLNADLAQVMRRHVRLLTKGDERFAREEAHVWFVQPRLSSRVVASVPEKDRREKLEKGSIYERYLSQRLHRLEESKLFTTKRAPGSLGKESGDRLSELLRLLNDQGSSITDDKKQYQLLQEHDLLKLYPIYRTPVKKVWRAERWIPPLAESLKHFHSDVSDVRIATLSGAEAHEIPELLRLGIIPTNIHAFDHNKNKKIQQFGQTKVSGYGARFHGLPIEVGISDLNPMHAILLDTDGYTTRGLCELYLRVKTQPNFLLSKNSLCGRENEAASEILRTTNGDRRRLDLELLRLVGTESDRAGPLPVVEILLQAQKLRALAANLSPHFAAKFLTTDERIWCRAIGDLLIGSPHLLELDQFQYLTPSGRPFLSTIARMQHWDASVTASKTLQSFREKMRFHVKRRDGESFDSTEVSFLKAPGNRAEFRKLYEYYSSIDHINWEGALQNPIQRLAAG